MAKPSCTRNEEGRITTRGHSQRGAIAARRILWELGFNFTATEQVSALVRYHQLPFHLINRPDAQRMAFLISQTARCESATRTYGSRRAEFPQRCRGLESAKLGWRVSFA